MATSSAFSARAVAARRSAIRTVFDAAEGRADLVRLEIGEPSFTTPAHIIEAARAAALAGFTGYTPNGGYASTRELLADRIERVNGYRPAPEDVVVTPGAMNALFSIYFALLNPGDEVLLPTPGFPNMDEMVRVLGGEPVFYPLRSDAGYLPDPQDIASLITERTKAIFVNSPGNPTGAVFPRNLVAELLEVSERAGTWLISDEVYDDMLLDDDVAHVSPRRLAPEARVVSVYSMSKIYAMTGWRLGYCAAPRELAALLRKLQEPQTSCPSAISQKAAEAALTGPQEPIAAMRDAYRRRRDVALAAAGDLGLSVFRTKGTFYMVVDITSGGVEPMDFTLRLLDHGGVSVAPGEVFGPGGAGIVRISLAVEPAPLVEGMRRIAAMLRQLARASAPA
jgi:aspartate aminotransferase